MFPCSLKPLGDLTCFIESMGRGAAGCEKRGISVKNVRSPWKTRGLRRKTQNLCEKHWVPLFSRNIHFGFLLGLENI